MYINDGQRKSRVVAFGRMDRGERGNRRGQEQVMARCAFGALAIVLAIAPSIARAEPATTTNASSEAAVARLEIDHTLANMRGRARHVRDLLRETRKKGDPKRIACLDEVLSRCDVAARHARELGDEVNAAYARNEVD